MRVNIHKSDGTVIEAEGEPSELYELVHGTSPKVHPLPPGPPHRDNAPWRDWSIDPIGKPRPWWDGWKIEGDLFRFGSTS